MQDYVEELLEMPFDDFDQDEDYIDDCCEF